MVGKGNCGGLSVKVFLQVHFIKRIKLRDGAPSFFVPKLNFIQTSIWPVQCSTCINMLQVHLLSSPAAISCIISFVYWKYKVVLAISD